MHARNFQASCLSARLDEHTLHVRSSYSIEFTRVFPRPFMEPAGAFITL